MATTRAPEPLPADPLHTKQAIAELALGLGFDAVGVAPAALAPEARDNLQGFLARGYHGEMGWLERRAEERASPTVLWPAARSVIVLGANYGPTQDPQATLAQPAVGTISVYARGSDYHDVLRKRVKQLARQVVERFGGEVKLFVDTAPVMEKPLAQAAGIGWQGKHTNLVSRAFGSWLFLAELFTTLELPADAPEADHCGACTACLDACPTRAFPAPRQLDARRCISYLTIEHKGHIAPELRPAIGNRIYGCDDCLAVCPWNKFARVSREARFAARPELDAPTLATLAGLDNDGFRQAFSDSPIKRVGRDRFVRNVLIALGNSGDQTLVDVVLSRLNDESPLVRAMAVWALIRLVSPARLGDLRERHLAAEPDASVRAEWTAQPDITRS